MAWEAVSKAQVASTIGVDQSILIDLWYDAAVAVIGRHADINNVNNVTTVIETRRVAYGGIVRVYQPPIYDIISVAVDGVLLTADQYYVSGKTLYIREPVYDKTKRQLCTITYLSGTDEVDYSVALAIALIIKELANMRTLEGAKSLIQFYRPGQSKATEQPLIEWGTHGKIIGIAHSLIGKKFLVQ